MFYRRQEKYIKKKEKEGIIKCSSWIIYAKKKKKIMPLIYHSPVI
jgi:hypothetical protein